MLDIGLMTIIIISGWQSVLCPSQRELTCLSTSGSAKLGKSDRRMSWPIEQTLTILGKGCSFPSQWDGPMSYRVQL